MGYHCYCYFLDCPCTIYPNIQTPIENHKMKTYYFWVTLKGQAPMKVAEDGRIASEAKRIVEARFPGAKVMFAEGF